MKVNEFLKKLKKQGCYFDSNGGKHDKWVNRATGDYAYVPRHGAKEIKTGTMKGILKDLGLK